MNYYDLLLAKSLGGSGGGGGGGTDIGIDTPKANLLSMIYALNNGTAKTGTFTLPTTIPDTTTEIFDAGSSSVTQFVILKEGEITLDTANNPVQSFMVFWLQSSEILERFAIQDTIRITTNNSNATIIGSDKDISVETGGSNDWWVYAHWTFANGVLNVKGQYNKNATYTPFRANATYRWIAW